MAQMESELASRVAQLEDEFTARVTGIEGAMATKADVDTLQDQIATLKELIERTRDGVYDNAERLFVLSEDLQQAKQRQEELAQRLAETAQGSDNQFQAVEAALADIRQQLEVQRGGLAASELNLEQLERVLEQVRQELAAELAALSEDQTRAAEALGRVDAQLLAAIDEIRREIAANKEAIAQGREATAATEQKLAALEEAISDVRVSLLDRLGALEADNAALQDEVDGLVQEVLILQSKVGLSEEQVQELTLRVKEELANQLALSLAREGQLERDLANLRAEFDSYRQATEERLGTANTAQLLGILGIVLGVIGFFM